MNPNTLFAISVVLYLIGHAVMSFLSFSGLTKVVVINNDKTTRVVAFLAKSTMVIGTGIFLALLMADGKFVYDLVSYAFGF